MKSDSRAENRIADEIIAEDRERRLTREREREFTEELSEAKEALSFQLAVGDRLFDENRRLLNIISDLLPFAEAYLDGAPSHPGHAKLETARAALKP